LSHIFGNAPFADLLDISLLYSIGKAYKWEYFTQGLARVFSIQEKGLSLRTRTMCFGGNYRDDKGGISLRVLFVAIDGSLGFQVAG